MWKLGAKARRPLTPTATLMEAGVDRPQAADTNFCPQKTTKTSSQWPGYGRHEAVSFLLGKGSIGLRLQTPISKRLFINDMPMVTTPHTPPIPMPVTTHEDVPLGDHRQTFFQNQTKSCPASPPERFRRRTQALSSPCGPWDKCRACAASADR